MHNLVVFVIFFSFFFTFSLYKFFSLRYFSTSIKNNVYWHISVNVYIISSSAFFNGFNFNITTITLL